MHNHQAVNRPATLRNWIITALLAMALCPSAQAIEIVGVQNAALDQPRINAALRLPGKTEPLTATIVDIFGTPIETFNIQAFYDTGASGVVVDQATAEALGLPTQPGVIYADVGVGGEDHFAVSEPIHVHLAPFDGSTDVDNPDTFEIVYDRQFAPLRAQITGPPANPLLSGFLDIFGMPLFGGLTVVMDARPVNQIFGTMETRLYDSTPNNPNVPITQRHIQMRYATFDRFTRTFFIDQFNNEIPLDPQVYGPVIAPNPFIGPDPLDPLATNGADPNPGITVTYNGHSTSGSWLFDTGAVTSILSEQHAAALGVTYGDPDPITGQRILNGVPPGDQFNLSIGGVGGTLQASGFFLDSLVLPALEGNPDHLEDPMHLRFIGAPVLVADITLADPTTEKSFTFDGVLGMNYLVGSIFLSEPFQFGEVRAGAFDFLTFDEPSGILGLRFDADRLPPGDLNGDGRLDNLDIAPFHAAVASTDEADFHTAVPWGIFEAGDFTADGAVDAADTTPFIESLGAAASTAPQATGPLAPEPGILWNFVLGGWFLLGRRT